MPVWYRSLVSTSGRPTLELDCLVPRWSDVAHHLAQEPAVVLIVQASSGTGLRWLQIQGKAGDRQVPDVNLGLATGFGGCFWTDMIAFGSEKIA